MKKILFLLLILSAIPSAFAQNEPADLFSAARTNNVTLTQSLLDAGADINRQDDKGYTALIYATYDGNYEVARFLLRHGADTEIKDRSGRTALMGACFKGQDKEVELLVENGAHVDATDAHGLTSKMYALMSGHLAIVQELRTAPGATPTSH